MAEPGEFSYAKGAFVAQVNAGTTARAVTLQYPADGVQVDDLLMAVFVILDDASATIATPSGWTLVRGTAAFGTAKMFVFVKRRASGQSETSQAFTVTGSASVTAVMYRLRNVTDQGIIAGTGWSRSGSGETLRNRALSVTTVDPYSVVLAISGERTNADESATWANAITNGMTIIDQLGTGTSWPNGSGNSIVVAYKEMDVAGASGDTYIPYPNAHASNGYAFHLVIKREGGVVTPPPETGQIGMHAPVNPSSDSISVGLDKLGGTLVEVALMSPDGLTQIDRKTVSADTTTGWANATFTGLESAAYYRVWFYVDGVKQTDAALILRTLPVGPSSYTVVAGSCQFTGSNHPVFDRIREDNPLFVAHMGDLHYADATTEAGWRAGHEASFAAPRFKQLFETTFISWAPDNHDRIITNPTGTGTGLNLGETDPQTAQEWKYFAGSNGWSSSDTLGRTWVAGRVRYIQTDAWSVRDDADGDPSPRTFLGATQKAWFKNVLDNAQEPLIIWFCQWTATNHANGRWNSFPEESSELEAFINARPDLKRRMVLVGGDSHGLQADDGSRPPGNHRFGGIPSLNVSGFNRSSDSPNDGQTFWTIVNSNLRPAGQLEADWGGYSRITINDDGMHIRFLWEAMRVNAAGTMDRVAFYTRSYGSPYDRVFLGDIPVSSLNVGDKTLWQEPYYGATI